MNAQQLWRFNEVHSGQQESMPKETVWVSGDLAKGWTDSAKAFIAPYAGDTAALLQVLVIFFIL